MTLQRFTLFALLTAGGCASVPKAGGFDAVQREVADRTGHQVQWRGQTAEDAQLHRAVADLLANDLTANQAVQVALLNNRTLAARFEDLGIAQADLVQAGLLKNPIFSGSWRFPDHSPRVTNVEYSVAEDFLDLLVLPLRKRVAQQEFDRTRLSIGHDVLELAAEVKEAFYTMQARAQLVQRLRLVSDINQAAAELATRQREAGTLNELGEANQQVAYEESKVDVAQAEAQLAADRERLNRLMGLWGDQTTWKIANRLPDLPAEKIPLDRLESLAMRQRLDVLAARAQTVTLREALAAKDAYRYFANAEVGVSTEKDPDGVRVTGPTLSLQLPIFDQGQAQVAQLAAQFRQSQRRLEALAIDARSEVREARDRLVAQRALVEHYQRLLPQRVRILNLTLQHYNGMLKGAYDLLLAKQAEVATERAYIESWRDYWIARTQLERALGGKLPGAASPTTMPSTMPMPGATPDAHDDHHHNH
jgi:cobalt-zinc-cadmium efflux system outer membrane protein